MKKILALALAIVLALSTLSLTAFAAEADHGTLLDGVVNNADPSATFITAEIDGLQANESVEVKLYSGDSLLATTSWKKEFPIADAKGVMTTVKICITATSSSWKTVWEEGKLSADYIPDKATLIVDGVECNTALIEMIDTDLEPVVWADTVPYHGTLLDGVVNVADPSATYITAEIDGLNAKESVAIKLYSGDTLLATTTWNKEFPIADEKGVMTSVKICITATSSSWKTVWETGKLSADYIPDKATLIVDDVVCNTALIEMIDTDLEAVVWADLVPVSAITVVQEGEGTVVLSKEKACEGEKIEVTLTPAAGYNLGYVEILDGAGEPVAFENNKFEMPASEVTVNVYFTEAPVYEVSVSVLGTGRVTTSQNSYYEGATVRLNVTHKVGYVLSSITVTDVYGNDIPVDGTSFEMPGCEVEVCVVFKKVLPKPATMNFKASVELEGAELEAGSFKFQLSYIYRGKEYVIETIENPEDGKIEFAPNLVYAPHSYTFFIKQIALDDAGIEYDMTVYEISAEIDYSKGYLSATLSQNDVVFVNYAK